MSEPKPTRLKLIIDVDYYSERDLIKTYMKAEDMSLAIDDFKNFLRSKIKYAPNAKALKTTWEEVQKEFFDHFGEVIE